MSDDGFDDALESYQRALGAFLKGDPKPVAEHFSQRDDVTLANPLGPPRLGRADVDKAIELAAANFQDGHMRFEEISSYAIADLATQSGSSEERFGWSTARARSPHRCG